MVSDRHTSDTPHCRIWLRGHSWAQSHEAKTQTTFATCFYKLLEEYSSLADIIHYFSYSLSLLQVFFGMAVMASRGA